MNSTEEEVQAGDKANRKFMRRLRKESTILSFVTPASSLAAVMLNYYQGYTTMTPRELAKLKSLGNFLGTIIATAEGEERIT